MHPFLIYVFLFVPLLYLCSPNLRNYSLQLRINGEKLEELLSERAVQFRAIQRRLLTRFRDKTPAPLQHLDTLLDGTYKQVSVHWWPLSVPIESGTRMQTYAVHMARTVV